MFETWFLTVFSEMERPRAICLLLGPRARAVMISSSRSVRVGAEGSSSARRVVPSSSAATARSICSGFLS